MQLITKWQHDGAMRSALQFVKYINIYLLNYIRSSLNKKLPVFLRTPTLKLITIFKVEVQERGTATSWLAVKHAEHLANEIIYTFMNELHLLLLNLSNSLLFIVVRCSYWHPEIETAKL